MMRGRRRRPFSYHIIEINMYRMNTYTFPRALAASAVALLLVFGSIGVASALSTITSSLDFGASGSNVMSLQQFLAADSSVYPEAIVSGYYGPLTRAAVQRYQCKQGIVCSGSAASTGYGRVGPRTLAAINASIGGVSNSPSGDSSAPLMSIVLATSSPTSATFTWSTNEAAKGTIYYSLVPFVNLEVTSGVPLVSAQSASEAGFGLTHTLSIPNLATSTTYYFMARSDDASGNSQFSWPTTFRTAQ